MIEVRFTKFQLEKKENSECNDFVLFKYRDIESDKMCGTRKQNSFTGNWVALDTNQLEIVFFTDDSLVDRGFRLQWRPHRTVQNRALFLDLPKINLKMSQNVECSVSMVKDTVESSLVAHKSQLRSRSEQIKSRRLDNRLKRTFRMLPRSSLFNYPRHKRTLCQNTKPQELLTTTLSKCSDFQKPYPLLFDKCPHFWRYSNVQWLLQTRHFQIRAFIALFVPKFTNEAMCLIWIFST